MIVMEFDIEFDIQKLSDMENQEVIKEEIIKQETSYTQCGAREIIIREGHALPAKEPERVNISGTIDTPARWAENRKSIIPQLGSHMTVDRQNMRIELVEDERSPYSNMLVGTMTLSDKFKEFGINGGKYITNFEMANLFKMNRSFFETKAVCMELVSKLKNLKASINKQIEASNNDRGNRRELVDQVVQHNIPESFKLTLPIFNGTDPQEIEVEINVDADDLSCTLISPHAKDLIEQMRNEKIDDVIKRVKAACPDIVVIEV